MPAPAAPPPSPPAFAASWIACAALNRMYVSMLPMAPMAARSSIFCWTSSGGVIELT